MAKNTRKHQRYPYIASAAIRVINSDDEPVTVMVNNISLGGMGVFMEKPPGTGTEISIEINFISMYGAEVRDTIHGKVSSVNKKDDLYLTGISFNEELNPGEQPNIFELFHDSIKGN